MDLRIDKVRGSWFDMVKPAHAQLYHLMRLFQNWFIPVKTMPIQIMEWVALDCFMRWLPKEL